jgi:hypothetical protein
MRGLVWIILLLIVVGLTAAVLGLGAFPPEPKSEVVQKIVPNERFAPKP